MNTESTNAQDARVEALWATLDTRQRGEIDLAGLKRGLRKLDHPLKNADHLLTDILKAVDADGDGRIQYNEFSTFVKQTEQELWRLFKTIDYNNDGKISKDELRAAFRSAGLTVPSSKLDDFFLEVDSNRDGVISFEEWRDFLLFMPATTPSLRAVLSYFQATMKVNVEGDAQISDDTIEGLGILQLFLNFFFGVFFLIANTPPQPPPPYPLDSSSYPTYTLNMPVPPSSKTDSTQVVLPPQTESGAQDFWSSVKDVLIAFTPTPGYFVAGGLAGAASRTATAPFDRLKVYLIAQTNVTKEAVSKAKSGNILNAAARAWQPLATATKELWQAGGIRSLYAGNGLNIVKIMPESAIKFGSYEAAKRAFASLEGHNDTKALHTWSQFLAGGVAGMMSQFSIYPLDTLKFRMQCETVSGGLRGNQLIVATAKKMWRSGGIAAYYRGLPLGLFGIFPYAALDLGSFEGIKRYLTARIAKERGVHESDVKLGGIMTAAIGAFSGTFGASAVYPLNLIRTRLQSQGTVLHPQTYTGIMDVTRRTLEREGPRGLFKGLTPNLLKVVPAVSITYVVYDKSKQAFNLPD